MNTENITFLNNLTVDLNFPVVYLGIAVSLLLILANSWRKSPVLDLVASVFLVGVYFEPEMFDTYYQAGTGILILFCWLQAFFHYKYKRSYG